MTDAQHSCLYIENRHPNQIITSIDCTGVLNNAILSYDIANIIIIHTSKHYAEIALSKWPKYNNIKEYTSIKVYASQVKSCIY